MTISLTVTTSELSGGNAKIDRNDILIPINEHTAILENILNGAQSAESFRFDELAVKPSTPASGKWKLYSKSSGLFYIDDGGNEYGPFVTTSALGGLSTGLLKVTTGTGVISTAVRGTDYSFLGAAHVEDVKAQNTAQTVYGSGAWEKVDLTTETSDSGAIVSLSSSVIATIQGTYKMSARMKVRQSGSAGHVAIRLRNTSDNTTIAQSVWHYLPAQEHEVLTCEGYTGFASTKNIELQFYGVNANSATNSAANIASESERYASVFILRMH